MEAISRAEVGCVAAEEVTRAVLEVAREEVVEGTIEREAVAHLRLHDPQVKYSKLSTIPLNYRTRKGLSALSRSWPPVEHTYLHTDTTS